MGIADRILAYRIRRGELILCLSGYDEPETTMGIADRPGIEPAGDMIRRIDKELALIRAELFKSMTKHAPMHSPHEGMSVIREEEEELWQHVMADTGRTTKARKEARQVAAMGLRYVLDLCQNAEEEDEKIRLAELEANKP